MYPLWYPLCLAGTHEISATFMIGIHSCLNELRQRNWDVLKVEPLDEKEKKLFIQEYMSKYSKSLTTNQLNKLVSSPQCNNPLFLKTILEELRVFGVFEQLDVKIEHYLSAATPPQLFQFVFQRLEDDFNSKVNY